MYLLDSELSFVQQINNAIDFDVVTIQPTSGDLRFVTYATSPGLISTYVLDLRKVSTFGYEYTRASRVQNYINDENCGQQIKATTRAVIVYCRSKFDIFSADMTETLLSYRHDK